jgi:hypothetical protein
VGGTHLPFFSTPIFPASVNPFLPSRTLLPPQLSMTKTTDRIIHSNQEIEDFVGGPHLPGGDLECVTPVVSNDFTPDWSHCCDVTAATHKYILLEVK